MGAAAMGRWQGVLFDLDGSLVDTAEDFQCALAKLCDAEGRALPSASAIRARVSDGARALVRLVFGETLDEGRVERLRERLLSFYGQSLAERSQPFPGIRPLLSRLAEAKLPWGVVTNKPQRYASPLLKALDLHPKTLVCPEHVRRAKPHPDALWLACQQLRCPCERAVYIGDHRRDMEAAQRAGLTAIAAVYGYLPVGEDAADWPAAHRVDSVEELWPLISRHAIAPALTR